MSCLLFFILFLADAGDGAKSVLMIDHPISQALFVIGGVGLVAYIGATRGPRIRLPHHALNAEEGQKRGQDETTTP